RLDLGFARLQFALIEPGAQHRKGLLPILDLLSFSLTMNHDAARHVGDADRAVGLVDVLPAGSGGAIGVDAQILVLDLDFDLLVDDRIDPDRGKARMPPRVRVEGRDAHEAVDAAFSLQPAIGIDPADLDRRRFDAGAFTGALFEPFDLVIMVLGPAHIHAQQHLGPVLRLGAAGPRMHFELAIIAGGLAPHAAP